MGIKRGNSTKSEARLLNQLNSDININNGYTQAINYYSSLKNKFLNQVLNQAKHRDEQFKLQTIEDMEKQIQLKTLSSAKDFDKTGKMISLVEEKIAKFLDNGEATEHFLNEFKSQLQQKKNKENKDIIGIARKILEKNNNLKFIDQQLKLTNGGLTSSDLYTRFANFFSNAILQGLNQIQTATNLRTDSLAGYYHELAATQALENTLYKTMHAGSKNVSADIFIGSSDGKVEDAVKQLQNIENQLLNFNNQNGSGQSTIDMDQFIKDLPLEYFGSQVKLWSMALSGLSRSQGYGIGNREKLLQQLKSEYKTKNTKYITERQNLGFFAQFQRIVLALGANNIIYSMGYDQMWTSDFIRSFRSNNYYLGFNRNISEELTSYVKLTQLLNANLYKNKSQSNKKKSRSNKKK